MVEQPTQSAGSGSSPTPPLQILKAHQRVRREQIAQSGEDIGILGEFWKTIDIDIKKAIVKPIDRATAKEMILKYEWLGCMPAVCWYYFGIFFDGHLGGVVVYGPEYSENLGKLAREQGRKCADWSKFGYEGKMILLSRGACAHWAHPHSASKLIRVSMRMLPEKFKVVTATVDDLAGEIGTIYQACGFDYVGSMRDHNPNVKSKKGDRRGWKANGKLYGSRAIRQLCGSTKEADVRKVFPDFEKVPQNSKGRYFAFRGTQREIAELRGAISKLIKPYPKRAPVVV